MIRFRTLPSWATVPPLALGCLLVAACQQASAPPSASGQTSNSLATPPRDAANPSLDIATVDGARFSLAQHRGQWVVVNVWATWCSPCLKEMPELSALHAMREHITVVGLAYEDITAADMQAFLREHPVTYPIAIIDMAAPPADFETPKGLPVTYLIAPDGRVVQRFMGPVTAAELESAIAAEGGAADVPVAAAAAVPVEVQP